LDIWSKQFVFFLQHKWCQATEVRIFLRQQTRGTETLIFTRSRSNRDTFYSRSEARSRLKRLIKLKVYV
jgi:hypothetical protein